MAFLVKFLVAFCSICYELILAQSLSAFLENTVLRYSITIGLYMFAMGMGALVVERRRGSAVCLLWKIEVALTIIGALGIPSLFLAEHLLSSRWFFALWAHGLILLIGFLTGFELPLVLRMVGEKDPGLRHKILAFDYAGAFAGSLFFVFFIYPLIGLVPAGSVVALLNAVAGLLLVRSSWGRDLKGRGLWQIGLVVCLIAGVAASPLIEKALLGLYLP